MRPFFRSSSSQQNTDCQLQLLPTSVRLALAIHSEERSTAPLALSSTERLHKKPFACLPTALRPSGPVQQWIFHQAEQELTTLPGLRYSSGHRKGRLKILSIEIIGRIRALAKKAPTRKDCLDANETIQEVIALAHGEVQRNGIVVGTQLSGCATHFGRPSPIATSDSQSNDERHRSYEWTWRGPSRVVGSVRHG